MNNNLFPSTMRGMRQQMAYAKAINAFKRIDDKKYNERYGYKLEGFANKQAREKFINHITSL